MQGEGNLFKNEISNWETWSVVFHSMEAFEPLVQYILKKENLPVVKLEECKPGTNAVFKAGSYVVKVYAPKESGMQMESDYFTELFSMERAKKLGIHVPAVIAKGEIEDKYVFKYIIMEYACGIELADIKTRLSDEDKRGIGKQLRDITDRWNTHCEAFNNIEVKESALRNTRWNVLPANFVKERQDYVQSLAMNDLVYVHGDLTEDNILVDDNNTVTIIDFADSLLAPKEYELTVLICEAFKFAGPYLEGFFETVDLAEITEKCLNGLLLHNFGLNIIQDNIGHMDEIDSIATLRSLIYNKLKVNR
ncbi:MAG: aminoglycoside phosphotransferase family protein [Lachnospiraceae bacterium]|nr:aminoglycoside phosphotransferase family protein [Lachnospiraceae bacterium]